MVYIVTTTMVDVNKNEVGKTKENLEIVKHLVNNVLQEEHLDTSH